MVEKAGIDYGMGTSNRDENFHYGVISMHEVMQVWCDSSEAIYPEAETCETCNGTGNAPFEINNEGENNENEPCEDCNGEGTVDNEGAEALGFIYNEEGYSCEQGADDSNIFITKSPYFTTCAYCSPCAPGAGWIMTTVESGIKTYCFDHEWFEGEKAPYPVFDCKTGLPVEGIEE